MFERKSFYAPLEVARITGQHPSTILRYIHEGRLHAVRLSERTYRIPHAALLSWLEDAAVQPIHRRSESGASAVGRQAARTEDRSPVPT